jgi:Cation transporter/ATPase, N-terminus
MFQLVPAPRFFQSQISIPKTQLALEMDLSYTKSADQVLAHLGVDAEKGLSTAQASIRIQKHGKNGCSFSFQNFQANLELHCGPWC